MSLEPIGEMRLLFANGITLPFAPREMTDVLQRRSVVGIIAICSLAMVLLPAPGSPPEPVGWASRSVAVLVEMGLFLLIYPAFLRYFGEVLNRRGWLVIPEPAVTAVSATCVALISASLQNMVFGAPLPPAPDLALRILACILYWLGVVHVVLIFVYPVFSLPLQNAARSSAGSITRHVPNEVRIGRVAINPSRLKRIESDDHYLLLVTDDETHRVNARLSKVAAELTHLGTLVHRSHWVAFREFEELSREGRRFMLTLRSGDKVPVSRGRSSKVAARLSRAGKGRK